MAATVSFAGAVVLVAMLVELAVAVDHLAGGPNGWDGTTNLETWGSDQTFHVGDNLVFLYRAKAHDVVEVTKEDFDNCQATNPIAIFVNGNTTVPLTTPGKRYFICAMPGHCSQGMKLEVDTKPPSSSAATAVAPPEASPSRVLPPAIGRLPGFPGLAAPLVTPASAPVSEDAASLSPVKAPLLPGQVAAGSPASDATPEDSSSPGSPLLPGQVSSVSPSSEDSPLIPSQSPLSGAGSTTQSMPAGAPLSGPGKSVTSLPSTTATADVASAVRVGSGRSLALGFIIVSVMLYVL